MTTSSGWCLDQLHGDRCHWKPCTCQCHQENDELASPFICVRCRHRDQKEIA